MNVITLGSPSTGAVVTNTTAETLLKAFSIPVNLFDTNGRTLRWSVNGSITFPTTTPPSVTFRTRISASSTLGTLVVASSALTLSTSTSPYPWLLRGTAAATSTATQDHWTELEVGPVSGLGANVLSLTGGGASTKDADDALRLQVTAQLSAASTSDSVSTTVAVSEVLR